MDPLCLFYSTTILISIYFILYSRMSFPPCRLRHCGLNFRPFEWVGHVNLLFGFFVAHYGMSWSPSCATHNMLLLAWVARHLLPPDEFLSTFTTNLTNHWSLFIIHEYPTSIEWVHTTNGLYATSLFHIQCLHEYKKCPYYHTGLMDTSNTTDRPNVPSHVIQSKYARQFQNS